MVPAYTRYTRGKGVLGKSLLKTQHAVHEHSGVCPHEHGSEYWDGGYYESDDDYLQAYDGDG